VPFLGWHGPSKEVGNRMPTTKFFTVPLSTALICLALSGCHQDVIANSTGSATDDCQYFCNDSTTETVPSTSDGDPTDGGVDPTEGEDPTGGAIDPSDFCRLHPEEDFPGFVHVCSGSVHGGIRFEYFGDPEIPLHSYMFCVDMSAPPYNLEKPEGYVYSCTIEAANYEFGPAVEQPNGHQIDACCLRDSPVEASSAYCRIDGAEEFCLGATDGLNAFRAELPHLPLLAEINQQLENLNKFLATSDTQTTCAKSTADGLLEAGNFGGNFAKAGWYIEHPQELDPEAGWPWFREIRMNVYGFEINEVVNNGLACNLLEEDALTEGSIREGRMTIAGEMGAAEVAVSGRFSSRSSDCQLASCESTLETFELQMKDFSVGSLAFSDVSVSLATPAVGLLHGDDLAVQENGMLLTATFRLTAEGRPMLGDVPVSVNLRNREVAHFQRQPDSSLAVRQLDVVQWPFKIELASR
jgi:hypothetical protein